MPAVQEALDLIMNYGGTDGDHHKQWVLDQVVRLLTDCPTVTLTSKYPDVHGNQYTYEGLGESEAYLAWCKEYEGDEDDEDNYYGEWDEGIAP